MYSSKDTIAYTALSEFLAFRVNECYCSVIGWSIQSKLVLHIHYFIYGNIVCQMIILWNNYTSCGLEFDLFNDTSHTMIRLTELIDHVE